VRSDEVYAPLPILWNIFVDIILVKGIILQLQMKSKLICKSMLDWFRNRKLAYLLLHHNRKNPDVAENLANHERTPNKSMSTY
jgi:hypothetical protein